MLKILHTADWHFNDKSIDECRRMIDKIIDHAHLSRPDLIVVAGDITDRNDVRLDTDTARLAFYAIERLSGIAPLVMIGGTHYHDGSIPGLLRERMGINVYCALDHPAQIALMGNDEFVDPADLSSDDLPLATISLIPAPTKKFLKNDTNIGDGDEQVSVGLGAIMAEMGAKAPKQIPHIGVGHWSIGGAYISETQQMIGRDIEVSRDQIESAHFDLLCLGHIHKAQSMWGYAYYSGSIRSNDAGELDDKGFYVHSIQNPNNFDDRTLRSEFITLPARKRLVVKIDFTLGINSDILDSDDDSRSIDTTLRAYTDVDIRNNFVKAEFKAWQDDAAKLDKKAIEEFFYSAGAHDVNIQIVRVPRENVRCKSFFKLKTLKDKLSEQASMRDESKLSQGVLNKIEQLETMSSDEIVKQLPTV